MESQSFKHVLEVLKSTDDCDQLMSRPLSVKSAACEVRDKHSKEPSTSNSNGSNRTKRIKGMGRNTSTIQNCFSKAKKTKLSLSKDEATVLDDEDQSEEAVTMQPLSCAEGPNYRDICTSTNCKEDIAKLKDLASGHQRCLWELDNAKE